MSNTHYIRIEGLGSSPLYASGLFIAKRDITTASGLSLAELEAAGYNIDKLARQSKTVKQARNYSNFLLAQIALQKAQGVVVTQ